MNIEDVIYNILKDNAGVSALVTTKIYPMVAPQGVEDCIVYQVINDNPNDTKSGVSTFNKPRVQVTGWSKNHVTAKQIRNAVQSALDRYTGTVTGINVDSIQYITIGDDFDKESHYYGKRSEYYIIIKS